MKIDWDKQPADFPLWLEGTNEEHRKHSGWYYRAGEVFLGVHGGQWRAVREGQFFTVHHKPDSSAWTGGCPPPVGTVCEFMKHNSPPAPKGQWTVGEIRYVSDCTVIIGGDKCEHVHHPRTCSFRPVRTPEQIAEEERIASAYAMCAVARSLSNVDAVALYDAGYRKQVKPC